MKTLMILTAALATAFVSTLFTATTAYANDEPTICSEVSFCTVFTTSTIHHGNLGGLAGADAICNERAAEASLPGIYMAWLADQTGSPSTRFVQSTVPYVLLDHATVANSYSALVTDGTLLHAIDLDESGAAVTGSFNWTNVDTDGTAIDTALDGSCNIWTFGNAGDFAVVGLNTDTTSIWTFVVVSAVCQSARHLYCFEQPQPTNEIHAIPTLSEWGMVSMVCVLGLLAVIGLFVRRTRRTVAGG